MQVGNSLSEAHIFILLKRSCFSPGTVNSIWSLAQDIFTPPEQNRGTHLSSWTLVTPLGKILLGWLVKSLKQEKPLPLIQLGNVT